MSGIGETPGVLVFHAVVQIHKNSDEEAGSY